MELNVGKEDRLCQVSTISFGPRTDDDLTDGELESSLDRTNDPSVDPSPTQEVDFPRIPGAELSVTRRLNAPWRADEPISEDDERNGTPTLPTSADVAGAA